LVELVKAISLSGDIMKIFFREGSGQKKLPKKGGLIDGN